MASDTPRRIVEATANLFQRHGYTGTGLKQISADSGVPFGSLYHFFPGGKEELAAQTLRWSAQRYAARVGEVLANGPSDDVAAAVRHAFDQAAEDLVATDFVDACPIATVALEVASSNEPLRQVSAEIFEEWLQGLDAWFVAAGVPEKKAREQSTLFLAALEGGFLLSRAARDPAPMRSLGRSVASQIAAAIDQPSSSAARQSRTRRVASGS
jgi:AcrR family transcriptional regulator